MLSRALLLPALALVLAAPVSGCAIQAAGGNDGRPVVVASFYPLQYVAQRIVGDHAEVVNLTPPGAEPHELELSPRRTAQLSGATVAFVEKGLQPAVDQAIENDRPEHVVDVADVVHLDKAPDSSDQAASSVDPHFWLDPTLLAEAADAFTTTMAEADPKHRADYRAGNTALQDDLRTLDRAYRESLAKCTTRSLVVSHDAFGYLGRRYDLDVHPIAGLSPDAEPSPRHLAELSDLIRTDKITTVFNERLASPHFVDTLASDLGISTGTLDPIEGLASSDSGADYLSLMRANLAAISKAGGCT